MAWGGVGGVLDELVARPAPLVAAGVALLVVAWSPSWRLTRTVVTIAHEGGHAVVAVLAGRGLSGIRLHADTSGVTHSTGAAHGFGVVAMFFAGYVFPPVLGLGGALLVSNDLTTALLWICVVLLVATLVQIRNTYGALAVLVTGGVFGVVAYAAEPAWQVGFATALCWFLLFGGLRAVSELARGRRRRRDGRSDADRLAALTGVAGGVWVGVFWLLAAAATATTGWVLLV